MTNFSGAQDFGAGQVPLQPATGVAAHQRPAARFKFFYGPMDCGKSTLALQIHYNHTRQGRRGLLLTAHDRSGHSQVTTRIGLSKDAHLLSDEEDVLALARSLDVDYIIGDEAQFYSIPQIEQLATLVDEHGVDCYAFGLNSDFTSTLFPASARLFELADEVCRLQVEVLCWCGAAGQLNGRVFRGDLVRQGQRVVIGDTDEGELHYQVLCRKHYMRGELSPNVGS
ncbi:thymidine kinase [Natronoglycomyces albus]|uniref:Thymidine kinase n=1 Tax=Natronoglycomyces albus TaxID=2811108 RepID=A0A895XM73_9ACTN|nr:thymidine kinase [Natronoglycomyces albus]QSB06771.1 thymidine kinase [Natronoglycomyces albus]